jgi:hypothetical protein
MSKTAEYALCRERMRNARLHDPPHFPSLKNLLLRIGREQDNLPNTALFR